MTPVFVHPKSGVVTLTIDTLAGDRVELDVSPREADAIAKGFEDAALDIATARLREITATLENAR